MSENRQHLEEFHLSASQIFTVFFHWESQPLVTVSRWSVVLSWASEYITSWEVPCIGLLGAFLILFHIFKTSNLPLMNQRLFIKLLKTDQNELFPFLTPFKAAILARISKFSIHYSWVLIMPRNWSSAVISLMDSPLALLGHTRGSPFFLMPHNTQVFLSLILYSQPVLSTSEMILQCTMTSETCPQPPPRLLL